MASTNIERRVCILETNCSKKCKELEEKVTTLTTKMSMLDPTSMIEFKASSLQILETMSEDIGRLEKKVDKIQMSLIGLAVSGVLGLILYALRKMIFGG